jgi:hypothetical protein
MSVALVPWNQNPRTDAYHLTPLGDRKFVVVQSAVTDGWLTQISTAPVSQGLYVSVAGLNNTSNFTAIFDQYRILAWEVELRPHTTEGISYVTTGPPSGTLNTVIDYDDATALVTAAQAQGYANCITTGVTSAQRRCLRPRTAIAAYSGAFTSFANVGDAWFDAASVNVQYYGVKALVDPGTAGNLQVWDLIQRVQIEWRSVR